MPECVKCHNSCEAGRGNSYLFHRGNDKEFLTNRDTEIQAGLPPPDLIYSYLFYGTERAWLCDHCASELRRR